MSTNTCQENTCIKSYNLKGPLFNQSRKNLETKCPCVFVPVEQYYKIFHNLFKSDWSEINFYMFKSGIGATKLIGEIDVNHGGVVFEIKKNNSLRYFMLGEVEISVQKNKVGSITDMLSSVFPTVNTKTKQINWNTQALILAGEICVNYLDSELNNINNPQERLNIVLQNCHLSLGGADEPVPLLFLRHNNSEVVNKLTNIIKVIKTFREADLSYVFIGCKSIYPDYKTGKIVKGYNYTCETFASLLSSYIYREFKTEIENNEYLHNLYSQLLLPKKTYRYQGFNNDVIKGRYENEQIFFKFLRPGFLNSKTQKIESVVGVKWNDLTKDQKEDCFKFYKTMHDVLLTNSGKLFNDIKDIFKNLKHLLKPNAFQSIKEDTGDILTIVKTLISLNLDNYWIRCYASQNYLDEPEPTYFSFPLKNNILLDNVDCTLQNIKIKCNNNINCLYNESTSECESKKEGTYNLTKYKYQGTIIENLITLTMSDAISGLDFDPFINLDLINKNIKVNNNLCTIFTIFTYFILGIISLVLIISLFFVIKSLIK